jgi:hypothetical protein
MLMLYMPMYRRLFLSIILPRLVDIVDFHLFSLTPGIFEMITGLPEAIASITTNPKASSRVIEGNIKIPS